MIKYLGSAELSYKVTKIADFGPGLFDCWKMQVSGLITLNKLFIRGDNYCKVI